MLMNAKGLPESEAGNGARRGEDYTPITRNSA